MFRWHLNYNEPVPLNEAHLVVETTLEKIKPYVKNFDLKSIYDSLKIIVENDDYDIVLKPFRDGYHSSWFHVDLQGFSEDEEIYIIISEPSEYINFELISKKIETLKRNFHDLFDETSVSYVKIPYAVEMFHIK